MATKKLQLMGVKLVNEEDYGKSAYEIAVDHGFEGTEEEWLASLKADVTLDELGGVAEEDLLGKVETIIEDDYDSVGPIYATMDATARNAASYVMDEQLADKIAADYDQNGPVSEVINNSARYLADTISKENIDVAIISNQLVSAASEDNKLIYSDPNDSTEHQVTPEQVGAAPAGYGLGEASATAQNWNTQGRNGFFKEKLNGPDGENLWYGLTCSNYNGEVTQMAFNPNGVGATMTLRHKKNNNPDEWEYVNPPMLEGIEYRTTERFNGKPVYTKLVDSETLKTPGSTNVVVSDESVNIIEIKAYLTRDDDGGYFPLPYVYGGNICAYVYAGYVTETGNTITPVITTEGITTILAGSTYTAHVTVKYTKDTEAAVASTTE